MHRGAFCCLWLFIAASWGRLSIENSTHLFRSSDGRARLFHGVNVVQKAFPWHPSLGEFDAHNSLNHLDMANLRKWGFNAVRLGVMWPGVEPTPGVYNYTYLAVMRRIVAELDLYGIATIIDFHQDVLSQQWCGEGVPGWLHQLLANSTGGIHDKCDGIFPGVASVFGVCVPFSKYNISTDPLTGFLHFPRGAQSFHRLLESSRVHFPRRCRRARVRADQRALSR